MVVETRSRLHDLVREDAAHRSLYLDPDVFSMEMRRIFETTWVYVGHESEIPNPGDFKTDRIGTRPIIVSRHTDGQIYVLLNSCSHRGSTVCELPSGNTKSFRCPYHSWTYKTNGDLALLPSRDRFGADFDLADYGLTRVARVASYRGFMFASLAEDGPDLDEHLGRAKHYIDIFVDRSPMGCVQVTKPLKYEYQGNWKLQMENMSDGYHAQYVHASAFGTSVEPPPDGRSGPEREHLERSFAAGHGIMGWWTPEIISNKQANPEYFSALVARIGEERAEKLAHMNLHLMVYPNLILHTNYCHIRVVRPMTVDHTEINTYPCKLEGAGDKLNEKLINATAVHVSPAGRVQVDDLEVFGRVTAGMRANPLDWVRFKMRGSDEHVNEYGEIESRCTSELVPRGYYREWLKLMSREPREPEIR